MDTESTLREIVAVFDIPRLVRHVGDEVDAQFAAAPPDRARAISRLYLSGCGDSLSAAVEALRIAAEAAQHTAREIVPAVAEYARWAKDEDHFFFLGAGPSHGTAMFGAAKLLEEVPVNGVAQPLEEWAHLQYFLALDEKSNQQVLVVAPPGASTDRAAEILRAVHDTQGVGVAITFEKAEALHELAAEVWPVAGAGWEGFSPVAYCVPLQLFGIALALMRGRTTVPLSRQDRYWLIRESAIIDRIPPD